MQYPTVVRYRPAEASKGYVVSKDFPSRTKAKQWLKIHWPKNFMSMTSEGKPEKVVEEK
jgi:hypothetical protein